MSVFLLILGILAIVYVVSAMQGRGRLRQPMQAAAQEAEAKGEVEAKAYVLPNSLNEMQFSPSDYVFAFLSKHVYESKAALKAAQTKNKSQKERKEQSTLDIKVNKTTETLADWEIHTIFTHPSYPSYQSVLYSNESKKQFILAYQGTNSLNDWTGTNIPGIVGNEATIGQQRIIEEALAEAIKLAKRVDYTLSLTGHSLGGWLAQVACFIAHDQYLGTIDYAKRMLKTVVFDSPGAQEMLDDLNLNAVPKDLKNCLDITSYVSVPNMVNTLNTHKYTTIHQVVDKKFSKIPVKYDRASHSMDNFVAVFDAETGAFKTTAIDKIETMEAWPSQNQNRFLWKLRWLWNRLIRRPPSEDNLNTFYTRYVLKYAPSKGGYQPYRTHKRHIPPHDYDCLLGKKDDKDRYIDVLEDTTWAKYLTIDRENKDYVTLDDEGKEIISDIRLALDELHSIALAHPKLHEKKRRHRGAKELNFNISPPKEDFFVGRTKEMEALAPYFDKKDKLVVLPPITGFGGLGKTQLVHELIEKYEDNYNHIVWINAATKEGIEASYHQVAKELSIKLAPNEDLKEVVRLVEARLNNKHVLYVFENPRNITIIKSYLKKGHVLISSRNNSKEAWRSKHYDAPLALAPFSEEEALNLAKEMRERTDTTAPDLIKLIQLLPKYPLVLRQLLSVMSSGKYSPRIFLQKMQKKAALIKELKTKPQTSTYKSSLSEITKVALDDLQSTENGQALLHLVQQLACLDELPIPLSFVLLALGKEGEEDLTRDILGDLERYGLIRWDEYNVYMHDVIQNVIGDLYPLTPAQVKNLVNRYIAYNIDDVEASGLYFLPNLGSQMLPHGEKLLEYVKKQRGEDGYTAVCYLKLSDLYCQQGNYQTALEHGQNALSIFKQVYGDNTNHPDIATAYNILGLVYHHQGLYGKAIEFLKKFLDMEEKVYGNISHSSISTAYNNLGRVYDDQGQYGKAIEYHEKALEMEGAIYGDKPHPGIATSYNNLGSVYANQGKHDKAIEYYKKSLEKMGAIYGAKSHPNIAAAYNNLGVVYKNQRLYDKAIAYSQKSLNMCKAVYGDTPHANIAFAYHNLGVAYASQGQDAQAIDYHQKALNIWKAVYRDKPHAKIANAYNNLGVVYHHQGKYDKSIECYEKSINMLKALYRDKPHIHIADGYNKIGIVYAKQEKYDKSIECYEKSINMLKALYRDKPYAHIATTYSNLGTVYDNQEQYDKALEYHQKALEMRAAVYGDKSHADIADSYNRLGFTYDKKGQYDKAIDYHQKSLEIYKVVYGDKPHPNISSSYNNLGSVYYNQRKYDQTIECLKKSLEIDKAVYGDKPHAKIATAYNNLGCVYEKQGQYDQAIEHYQEALNMYKAIYGDKPRPDIASYYYNLGNVYGDQGQYGKAIEFHQKALDMYKAIYGDKPHENIANSYHNLGCVYYKQGQYAKAIVCLKKSLQIYKAGNGDKPHASIAAFYNNLGYAYFFQWKFITAFSYWKKAKEIKAKYKKMTSPYAK